MIDTSVTIAIVTFFYIITVATDVYAPIVGTISTDRAFVDIFATSYQCHDYCE